MVLGVTGGGAGNVVAVGANQEDSLASGVGGNQGDNSIADSGAVYVWRRPSAGLPWMFEAYVKVSV